MKKFIIASFLACMAVVTVNAQAVVGNKFGDNWSFRFNVGATSASTLYNHGFFNNMRPVVGIGFDKKITPIVGFGLEFTSAFNTLSKNGVAFDNTNLMLFNNLNLNNLFAGYKGTPRLFEVETVLGVGWLHYYYNAGVRDDYSDLSAKLGLDLNFNLGENKAWTLALKPAIIYDLEKPDHHVQFNIHGAALEFTVGLRYHFKTSNGQHHFTRVEPPCDPEEINALNNQINALRQDVNSKAAALDDANRKTRELEQALEECRNQEPKTITETLTNSKKTMESIITFRQGSTAIDASQTPNVERIATYLKNHKEATVTIKGYASPEGSLEVNERIARQRAEAVKNMLTSKYKISGDRISAAGEGIGDMFEEADWNRVSICTIDEE